MIKEKLIIKKQEAAVMISGGNVDSIRFIDKLQTGFRVYKNGKIGIAGTKGKANEKEMWEKAEKALENNIDYDVEISRNRQENVYLSKNIMTDKDFFERVKLLIEKLNNMFPNFIFSNKIKYLKESHHLLNSEKLDLYFEDDNISVVLLIKEKSSSNIFDTGYFAFEREFNEENIIYDIGVILEHYHNIVDIEEGEYPIIINFEGLSGIFSSDLKGDVVASGASLFSDKICKKVFHENLNIYLDKNPETAKGIPFFDAEGVVNHDFRYKIIDKGVIVSPYSTKKIAKKFNLPQTGSAVSSFDGVPTLGEQSIYIKPGNKTLNEIVEGRKAIFVILASGGDYTSSGDFASPIQSAFLYDKGRIVGRINDMNISGNVFSMFNENFMGVPKDSLFKYNTSHPVILKMKVRK